MKDNKPCPFCGCKDIREDIDQYSTRFLQCEDCLATGPLPEIVWKKEAQDFGTYWRVLWEAWNKRK